MKSSKTEEVASPARALGRGWNRASRIQYAVVEVKAVATKVSVRSR